MHFFTIFWTQMKLWSVVQEVEYVAGLSALLNPHRTYILGVITVKYNMLVNITESLMSKSAGNHNNNKETRQQSLSGMFQKLLQRQKSSVLVT